MTQESDDLQETHSTDDIHACLWTLTIGRIRFNERLYEEQRPIGTASQKLLRYPGRSQVPCEPVCSGEPDHARQVSHSPRISACLATVNDPRLIAFVVVSSSTEGCPA